MSTVSQPMSSFAELAASVQADSQSAVTPDQSVLDAALESTAKAQASVEERKKEIEAQAEAIKAAEERADKALKSFVQDCRRGRKLDLHVQISKARHVYEFMVWSQLAKKTRENAVLQLRAASIAETKDSIDVNRYLKTYHVWELLKGDEVQQKAAMATLSWSVIVSFETLVVRKGNSPDDYALKPECEALAKRTWTQAITNGLSASDVKSNILSELQKESDKDASQPGKDDRKHHGESADEDEVDEEGTVVTTEKTTETTVSPAASIAPTPDNVANFVHSKVTIMGQQDQKRFADCLANCMNAPMLKSLVSALGGHKAYGMVCILAAEAIDTLAVGNQIKDLKELQEYLNDTIKEYEEEGPEVPAEENGQLVTA